MFGFTDRSSIIKNVSLDNINIVGSKYVGGLIGHNAGFVYGSTISGTVAGGIRIGGLIGKNSGKVQEASFNGTVSANLYGGGFIGENDGGVVIDSYSRGVLLGAGNLMGGLIGSNKGDIINSYSKVEVSGHRYIGGLIGIHDTGEVFLCHG